jgi:uncharacterized protein
LDIPKEQLIIFTRYPEPGKVKTRLIKHLGEEGAADLQRRMSEHTLQRMLPLKESRSLSLEVLYADDGSPAGNQRRMAQWLGLDAPISRQCDGNLGARMLGALSSAFNVGMEHVVIIGSDCPQLTAKHIKAAFEALKANDIVIGPAHDGGYYLIGLKQAHQPLFGNIPWGTDEVLSRTLTISDDAGLAVALLDVLNDVDRPEDLHIWEEEMKACKLPAWPPPISVVIPALNEASNIRSAIESAATWPQAEIIVVDGGSDDETLTIARECGVKTLSSSAGRAHQMNAGANLASGQRLLFLHADSRLPAHYEKHVRYVLDKQGYAAGAFRLGIDDPSRMLRIVETMINWRSRYLGMPYGDQAIFLWSQTFQRIGGFPDSPIMEDFALIRQLRRITSIGIAPATVLTSARRWKTEGVLKTTFINQVIVCAYMLGIPPQRLAGLYKSKIY